MYFNPRSPRGGATGAKVCRCGSGGISIHAPHEGERPSRSAQLMRIGTFQSTLPTRGSDLCSLPSLHPSSHFNPRSPRGGATGRSRARRDAGREFQSTLPTRGSDGQGAAIPPQRRISIHAPHEGERPSARARTTRRTKHFNPRSPRGGATRGDGAIDRSATNFNPRSPRGGATGRTARTRTHGGNFNPRSPRGGATRRVCTMRAAKLYFNPRSPRGGATAQLVSQFARHGFQSTLPTRGSDPSGLPAFGLQIYFNPRSPRGGATRILYKIEAAQEFQSTLPTRGSDRHPIVVHGLYSCISIHAPHEGERL